ncbi:hypothetical protein CSPAE12_03010 [Colletotrichum incanum]|nr:hypothetical protein CSPAE12_03010 [Colletotrichum incanum]
MPFGMPSKHHPAPRQT